MLQVQKVLASRRLPKADNYDQLDIKEKLYWQRSDLPAITHLDYSSRIQTVHRETNTHFWHLLNAFKQQTSCAILANTSFNVRGEPIVNTPEDSYRCFMRTEMDFLVIGNYIFTKVEQPEWHETDSWQQDFVLD